MAEDSVLNNIASEFKLWGVKFQQRLTNGGHIELAWQVSPDKEIRKTYLPHTGSDWRGWLNQRSHVRDLFRQDGLIDPRKRIAAPKPILHKALSVPEAPAEKPEDQIKTMRCEIADLTNFILELGVMVSTLIDTVKAQAMAQIASPAPVVEAPIAILPLKKTRAPSTKGINTIEFVSANWNSLEALARDMGISTVIAKRKLIYLAKQGKVELSDGRWRRTPEPKPKTRPKVLRGKPNGKAKPNGRRIAPVILAAKSRRNGRALNGHH